MVGRENKGGSGEKLRTCQDVAAGATTAILAGIGGGRMIAMLRFIVRVMLMRVMRLRHVMVRRGVHRQFMPRARGRALKHNAHDQKREQAGAHAGPSQCPEQCAESHTINFAAARENEF